MLSLGIYVVFLLANPAFPYTKAPTDYDRYGIKVALNDRLLVYSDNLFAVWYMEVLTNDSDLSCMISFNLTSCDYVYSVATPVSNNSSFVYNCIDGQGNNVIGAIAHIDQCTFVSIDERIVPVNATQDNFVIDLNQQGTGVYGFADDFFLYYELQPVPQLTVWPNALGISPRAVDIGWSNDYAVIVGYCQVTVLKATECGYVMRLNKALACPYATSNFSFVSVLKYPWSDPRAAHFIAQNRMYTAQLVMSVSVAWRAQLVLIGVQSLNKVLLFALNDTIQPIGIRQSGVGFMGYGKSVAWLDDDGHRAMILANVYTYATYLWVSSSIHVYDVQSDGFANTTQPIFIYPNSQQILHPTLVPSLLRLTSSPTGSVGIFDILGNGVVIIKAPAGSYPITNISQSVSVSVPCTLGTHRDYEGIEVCAPCSSSSHCSLCTSTDSFCPPGAVGEITHADFESIEQEQEYPESPENTVFDDLLMQNMFVMNIRSSHCTLVSPLTWVLVIIGIGCSVAIGMAISELVCPHKHSMRNRAKNIFRRMDLVGEGEVMHRTRHFRCSSSFSADLALVRRSGFGGYLCSRRVRLLFLQLLPTSISHRRSQGQQFIRLRCHPAQRQVQHVNTEGPERTAFVQCKPAYLRPTQSTGVHVEHRSDSNSVHLRRCSLRRTSLRLSIHLVADHSVREDAQRNDPQRGHSTAGT